MLDLLVFTWGVIMPLSLMLMAVVGALAWLVVAFAEERGW
jgi:hypothetical protein